MKKFLFVVFFTFLSLTLMKNVLAVTAPPTDPISQSNFVIDGSVKSIICSTASNTSGCTTQELYDQMCTPTGTTPIYSKVCEATIKIIGIVKNDGNLKVGDEIKYSYSQQVSGECNCITSGPTYRTLSTNDKVRIFNGLDAFYNFEMCGSSLNKYNCGDGSCNKTSFGSGNYEDFCTCAADCSSDYINTNDMAIYRFFNKTIGSHLYTISETEKNTVMGLANEWTYEGVKFTVFKEAVSGAVPVYRFWNSENGSHFFTINESEKDNIINSIPKYKYEGVKFYVYATSETNSIPVYRFYNTELGSHLYTTSLEETTTIIQTLPKFQYEGIKFYVL